RSGLTLLHHAEQRHLAGFPLRGKAIDHHGVVLTRSLGSVLFTVRGRIGAAVAIRARRRAAESQDQAECPAEAHGPVYHERPPGSSALRILGPSGPAPIRPAWPAPGGARDSAGSSATKARPRAARAAATPARTRRRPEWSARRSGRAPWRWDREVAPGFRLRRAPRRGSCDRRRW